MNWKTWLLARRWWIGGVITLLAAYFVLRFVLAVLSARQGFGSPDGTSPEFLVAVGLTSLLRGVLLFVIPAVAAFRLAWVAVRALSAPKTDGG